MAVEAIQELLEKMAQERRELLGLVEGLTEDETDFHSGGTEWCVKKQLVHLEETEKVWVDRAFKAVRELGEDLGPDPTTIREDGQQTSAAIEAACGESPGNILSRLKKTREAAVRRIVKGNFTQEELEQKGVHYATGEMTGLQILRSLYRHDRMHAEQIAGRPGSFRPRLRSER